MPMRYFLNAFSNIPVMPTARIDHRAEETCGGPVWPDWESRVAERHCRNHKPADQRPAEQAPCAVFDMDHAFWGGLVDQHFGHQIADFSMRIIPSRFVDPKARLVFSIGAKPPPPWFLDLLGWCGVERGSVFGVRQPTMFRHLRVVGQPEQLWGAGAPAGEHLDVMDRFMAAKPKLSAAIDKVVFVSRAAVPASKARVAGERYIEQCVEEAGGVVFRPETASIAQQMTVYRTARRLVFSQGSALHLLQLTGRGLGAVSILESRPGVSNFLPFLQPRCKLAHTMNVAPRLVAGLNIHGEREDSAAIAVARPELLVREFREAGLDIGRGFREEAFRREAHDDVVSWVKAALARRRRTNWRESYLNIAEDLRAAGYERLADRVVEVIAEVLQRQASPPG